MANIIKDHIVMVVSQGTSFAVNAVIRALRTLGFVVRPVNPVPHELIENKKDVWLYLVFLRGMTAIPACCEFLGRDAHQLNAGVMLVGSEEALAAARAKLPSDLVRGTFAEDIGFTAIRDAVCALRNANVQRRSLLLVDDDPVFLTTLRQWLSEEYDVVPVSSGAQALQFLAVRTPDLILLDYEMPVLNGPKVLESIRHESALQDLPVFFLTGVDDRSKVRQILTLHPEGYLLKSTPREQLLNTLREFFAGRT